MMGNLRAHPYEIQIPIYYIFVYEFKAYGQIIKYFKIIKIKVAY